MRFLATAVLTVALAAWASASATVRMSESAVVGSGKVTLGDVAVVETLSAAERAKMSGVVLAFIPIDAETVRIDANTVRSALSGAGVNLVYVNIEGPSEVAVRRSDAANTAKTLTGAIEKYVVRYRPKEHVAVTDVALDFTPGDSLEPVVTAARPAELDGRVRFDVADAGQAGETVGHAWATISRTAYVVVARRRVFGGSTLAAQDLELECRPATEAASAMGAIEEAVGRKAVMTLEAGKVITEGVLQNDVVVKRGDEVALEYESPAMTVTVRMVALENAAAGDVARLRRLGQRSEHLGRIVGPGRAVPLTGGEK